MSDGFSGEKNWEKLRDLVFVVDFNGILLVFSAILIGLFFSLVVVFRMAFSLEPCYLVLLGETHHFLKDS